jgi:ADP-heptose:LPS heptosyltransferase
MPQDKQRILVIRFSTFSDVIITVEVVKAILVANPQAEVIMLSNKNWADLFLGIERLVFVGVDLDNENKGLLGLVQLYRQLKKTYNVDYVADLHGVFYSHFLRMLFKFSKKSTAVIDKGSFEKFALVRKQNKIYRPLKHSAVRYIDVFRSLGFSVFSKHDPLPISNIQPLYNRNEYNKINIGFAPFTKHATKMYPLDRFIDVIRHFDQDKYALHFFGGGSVEMAFIKEWEKTFKHAIIFNHALGLADELKLMSTMSVMLTMDSANLHLASLVKVPVVSVWGPTHPHAGFYGLGQDPLNVVQVNLSCRPCSVFGNKKCWRGDHACMEQITPQLIIDKVENLVS